MCQGKPKIDVAWADRKLAKACATDASGIKRFGTDEWRILKRRLASLFAAPTLADMQNVPGGCHALSGDRKGQFAVSLTGPRRVVFEPDHDPLPLLEAGGLDLHRVTAIQILEVVDYHGR